MSKRIGTDIDMVGNRIRGLPNAAAADEAVNKAQLDLCSPSTHIHRSIEGSGSNPVADVDLFNANTAVGRFASPATNLPTPYATVANLSADALRNIQLASSYGSTALYYIRGSWDSAPNTWKPWVRIVDKTYGDTLYQQLDADLTAIAALTGLVGLLRKTAANTWVLDVASYSVDGHGHTASEISDFVSAVNALISSGDFLPKTGGTMAGDISMGTHRIVDLPTPTVAAEAVPLGYLANYARTSGADTFTGNVKVAAGKGMQTSSGAQVLYFGPDATPALNYQNANGLFDVLMLSAATCQLATDCAAFLLNKSTEVASDVRIYSRTVAVTSLRAGYTNNTTMELGCDHRTTFRGSLYRSAGNIEIGSAIYTISTTAARPPYTVVLLVPGDTGIYQVQITSAGVMTVTALLAGTAGQNLYFDGITFPRA